MAPSGHKTEASAQGLWPTALSEQNHPKSHLRTINFVTPPSELVTAQKCPNYRASRGGAGLASRLTAISRFDFLLSLSPSRIAAGPNPEEPGY
jgi:hypothetical protein